jgi:hypothetical protein
MLKNPEHLKFLCMSSMYQHPGPCSEWKVIGAYKEGRVKWCSRNTESPDEDREAKKDL